MTRLLLICTAAKFIADAVAVSPVAEITPIANLGLGGVIFWIWMQERKERRERQKSDDERYEALLQRFLEALSTRVDCPMKKKSGPLDASGA